MQYGICTLPYIPVRETPAEASELGTTLLFGETFHLLKSQGNWHQVVMDYDEYEGWIFGRHLEACQNQPGLKAVQEAQYLTAAPFQQIVGLSRRLFLGLGTPLPGYDGQKCFINGAAFEVGGHVAGIRPEAEQCLQIAEQFLETPYLWGGRSTYGIDCSGFTQILLRYAGVAVPRDAREQATKGQTVSSVQHARPGDLAFFQNDSGKIIHSGMIATEGNICHASEKVRKDRLDERGIYNETLQIYTHNLSTIRRFL